MSCSTPGCLRPTAARSGGTLPGTMRAFGAYWPRVKAFLGATIGPVARQP